MKSLFRGGTVFTGGTFLKQDILVEDGRIARMADSVSDGTAVLFDVSDQYIFPGFTDVHVHLREPGFIMKETIASGTAAAARGGYTTVCAMPNLNPPPDSMEHLQTQLDIISKTARVRVLPYGTITVGQKGETLSEMERMAPFVAGFSDDGRGVQHRSVMLAAMREAKRLGKIIAAHCEDNTLLKGGYIHDGGYAAAHGHKGICSESEWGPIKRDLALCRETGCAYHVCHVSTAESVELIRSAKREGLDVTCETAPHYLLLDENDLEEDGRFKMNPPLRTKEDRQALIAGLCDGTIDMIATDHAPHTAEEKSRGLKDSLMGVVGLETAFSTLYTGLVKTGKLSLERLVELLSLAPAKRFGLKSGIAPGAAANFTVFDLNSSETVDPSRFLSKGRSTPFAGQTVFGICQMTVMEGNIVWNRTL